MNKKYKMKKIKTEGFKMYKYLLWDIDGTILDFIAAEKCAIKALFKKYNIGSCTDEMIDNYSAINKRYWEALERGEMTKPQILVGRFEEFFKEINVDTAIAHDFNNDYQLTLGDYVIFEDGAVECLQMLKNKYKQIAVTNGTKVAQEKKLRTSGLDKIFDEVYISEDVGFEKPNKAYFDRIFAQEGILNLSEAIIIGDSLTSDILGGNNAGIDTCWYNPYGKINDKKVSITYEVNKIIEIAEILK